MANSDLISMLMNRSASPAAAMGPGASLLAPANKTKELMGPDGKPVPTGNAPTDPRLANVMQRAQTMGSPVGDHIAAQSLYATTPEQNAEIQRRQNALIADQNAAAGRDASALAGFHGNIPTGWQSELGQMAAGINPLDVLGPNAVNLAPKTPTIRPTQMRIPENSGE